MHNISKHIVLIKNISAILMDRTYKIKGIELYSAFLRSDMAVLSFNKTGSATKVVRAVNLNTIRFDTNWDKLCHKIVDEITMLLDVKQT